MKIKKCFYISNKFGMSFKICTHLMCGICYSAVSTPFPVSIRFPFLLHLNFGHDHGQVAE